MGRGWECDAGAGRAHELDAGRAVAFGHAVGGEDPDALGAERTGALDRAVGAEDDGHGARMPGAVDADLGTEDAASADVRHPDGARRRGAVRVVFGAAGPRPDAAGTIDLVFGVPLTGAVS
ncbi:MAG: hypothetical protein HOV83_41445 [Catenulispora sp.]|nr:hypothetical protein [Catenulispora sp.]